MHLTHELWEALDKRNDDWQIVQKQSSALGWNRDRMEEQSQHSLIRRWCCLLRTHQRAWGGEWRGGRHFPTLRRGLRWMRASCCSSRSRTLALLLPGLAPSRFGCWLKMMAADLLLVLRRWTLLCSTWTLPGRIRARCQVVLLVEEFPEALSLSEALWPRICSCCKSSRTGAPCLYFFFSLFRSFFA